MSGLNNSLLLGADAAAGGYTISRSLRFNSADSAYLSRTPASAGNRKTWTWAGWVKRGSLSGTQWLFECSTNATYYTIFALNSDALYFYDQSNGAVTTTAVYRDASAWMHVCLAVDTTQATASNRVKIYVNGSQVTALTGTAYPALNADTGVNSATLHSIGARYDGSYSLGFNGLLADIHFIDGQALDPTSFGEFDATTGVWVPKAFTGSYGTNGFRLDFSDNSAATATTLGKDSSGNGNNWTPNNLSVTAGAGNDSLVDVPTNGSETDTGVGGEVRGNYCTLNPLANPGSSTLSNGNLDVVTASASYGKVNGTIAVSSGKWYWEVVCTVRNQDAFIGIEGVTNANTDTYTGGSATGTGWYNGGTIYSNASSSSYGTTYAANDVIGVALDMDAGTLVFYKNGVSAGTAKTGLSGSYTASVSDGATSGSGNTYVCNFGQRPFAYTAPSGFKALNTASLPAPLVTKPSTVMDVKLYTGNGSTQTISGLNFSPDLVWIKSRSQAFNHGLYDTVRGATNRLISSSTAAEDTLSGVTAFNSNGFTMGGADGTNGNTYTYAAWCWDSGSSTVTNTQGSITSQVRANASAGFSVVTYTGNGSAGATVGHGLNVAPQLLINKRRSSTGTTADWAVWHKSVADISGSSYVLFLNTTDAALSASNRFNSTAPTSSVFTLGNADATNYNGGTFVTYCFAPVAGYSNGFSYTGNGSTDGSFVYLGFRPRLILLKCSSTTGNWTLVDTAREGYNVDNDPLYPNLSNAEGTTDLLDITSNGFKLRTTDASVNSNAATYVGFAWAESPFNYARAR